MTLTRLQLIVLEVLTWLRSATKSGRDPLGMFPVDVHRILADYCRHRFERVDRIRDPGGGRFVAELRRRDGLVAVSDEFRNMPLRWTLAHEIAHILLHTDLVVAHRDPPTYFAPAYSRSRSLPWREREANTFASCLLMPINSVSRVFAHHFGEEPLSVEGMKPEGSLELCLTLANHEDGSAHAAEHSVDALALAVSRADSWRGRPIRPLYDCFGVAPVAMAIKLRDCGLVCLEKQIGESDRWHLEYE